MLCRTLAIDLQSTVIARKTYTAAAASTAGAVSGAGTARAGTRTHCEWSDICFSRVSVKFVLLLICFDDDYDVRRRLLLMGYQEPNSPDYGPAL